MDDLYKALEMLSDSHRNVYAIEKIPRYRDESRSRKAMESRARAGLSRIMSEELLRRTENLDLKIKREDPSLHHTVEEYTVSAFVLTQEEASQLRLLIRNAIALQEASLRLEAVLDS